MCDKKPVIFGTVSWSGCVNGMPTVITGYKNGASAWFFKRKWLSDGEWVRVKYPSLAEAVAATKPKQKN